MVKHAESVGPVDVPMPPAMQALVLEPSERAQADGHASRVLEANERAPADGHASTVLEAHERAHADGQASGSP